MIMNKKLSPSQKTSIGILIIFLCAFVIRFTNINKYDLWFDELTTDMFSSRFLSHYAEISNTSTSAIMMDHMKNDPHSSLYYLSVYYFSFIFGAGKSLRLLSLFFSMLSLLVFYKLSRAFFNRQVSLIAFSIMAFHPFHLWYAQEARVYAMACFFAWSFIFVFFKALKTDKLVYWVLLLLSGILSVFASYHSALLLIGSGGAFFFSNNARHFKKWLLCMFLILLALLVSQPILMSQLTFVNTSFWLHPPTITSVFFSFLAFSLGYSATPFQYRIAVSLFIALSVYGGFATFKDSREKGILLLLLLCFPLLAIFALSHLITPIYISRQLLIFSPFYYLLIAKGIDFLGTTSKLFLKLPAILAVGFLLLASLVNYHQGVVFPKGYLGYLMGGVFPKTNYAELLKRMDEGFEEGDRIVVTDSKAYAITITHIIKNYKKNSYLPKEVFRFFFFADAIEPYEKRHLVIHKITQNIPKEFRSKMHSLRINDAGKWELQNSRLPSEGMRRIWLVSSGWSDNEDTYENSDLVIDHLKKIGYKNISSEKKGGLYIDLLLQTASSR